MPLDAALAKKYLKAFDLTNLFIEALGWDRLHVNPLQVAADGTTHQLHGVAEKRGMVVYRCDPGATGQIPSYPVRRKIEKQAAKAAHEHIVIYSDAENTVQLWQWIKREPGRPAACREHTYYKNQPGDALIQKLQHITFDLGEEESLSIAQVAGRARQAFDVERVTKRFYERFQKEHTVFLKFISGITESADHEWYASVMLNRLMFVYFIQRKGFLDGDHDYLRNRLNRMRTEHGRDKFYSFYRYFLLRLFHEGLGGKNRTPDLEKLVGRIPYLNGGLFDVHELEKPDRYGKAIQIPDQAFERIFDYFDQYQWHLDERPLRADNEINPDVLGYIFEKYINQKQMGAYYTKEDITEYISKNTVLPFLFDAARARCKVAFENPKGPTVWDLLKGDPDRYIYAAVRHGAGEALPDDIAAGLSPPTLHHPVGEGPVKTLELRKGWNRSAPPTHALPTETWREVITQRKRYEEVRAKLAAGEVRDVNNLITLNLDIRQFAQDVIESCEGPDLLRTIWHAIEKVTILDPTCGSGAFLFAALNILEPLYEACLDRMEAFVGDLDRSGEKHRPEKFSDFRKILGHVAAHPNRRYFIFKSIILNNLFGVDIMEEAVEICKLRLFLKLAAQVEPDTARDNLGIEPLPDIDFNIRAGNALVGYATYEEVKRAATSKFDFDNAMEKIAVKAADLQQAFDAFRERQVEGDGSVPTEHKLELRNRLSGLQDELNRYLAGEYGVEPTKKDAYAKWLKSHQPFHWFIEFYGIMNGGGFDVIIGNPPYVEYVKVKGDYRVRGYETESCGNLYAFVMERSFPLLQRNGGRIGLIVPISIASSERMLDVRKQTLTNCTDIWLSNFAIRPQPLFPEIMQRNSIVIGRLGKEGTHRFYSTNYLRWVAVERHHLFGQLCFAEVTDILVDNKIVQKVATQTGIRILKTINSQPKRIGQLASGRSGSLYFHDSGESYWTKTLWEKPVAYRDGERVEPAQWFSMEIPADERPFVYLLLNSSLLYWLWTVYTDCRHMTKGFIERLPLPANREIDNRLVERLKAAYSQNTTLFEKRPGYKSPEIKVQNFKPLIDEIDRVLARHYGFTEEELDFILNYDIKYRMGRDREDEDE